MKKCTKIRNIALAILGAVVIVFKPLYHGPFTGIFYAYGGNFAASFALYFAAINATWRYRRPCVVAACGTLLAVEVFEITNGFGIMANVYDPVDLITNAVGVAFAIIIDLSTSPKVLR